MSVQRLSNEEVEINLKTLVLQERELLQSILLHIQQIDTRRIYLDRAYSSTYEYLVKELSYSGSAAMRRLEAARLLKEIPVMSLQIESGALNLSQIGELSRAVKDKEKQSGVKVSLCQKQEILEKISGKTVSETQKEIALALDLELKEPERTKFQKDDSVSMTLTLSRQQYEKLCRCKDRSAHQLSQKNLDFSWASVIENLTDHFLGEDRVKESQSGIAIAAAELSRVNKSLTRKTRQIVFQRDQCCQYVDKKSGRKCGGTFGLEVDHIRPRFAGGDHDLQNLRMLCGKHNRHRYLRQTQIRFF